MNPTHGLPAARAARPDGDPADRAGSLDPAAGAPLTVAQLLRQAGLYLLRHGWHQGDMFADPDQPTPPACALGAIRMAVLGTPQIAPEHLTLALLDRFDDTVAALADHLVEFYGVDDRGDSVLSGGMPVEELVVTAWNDDSARVASHVIAACYGAADAWEQRTGIDLSGGVG
jgi:hypothetical protein